MSKAVVFAAGSLVVTAAAVCWATGVLPDLTGRPAHAPRAGRADAPPTPPASTDGDLSVYFSPDGGCTEAIVREVGAATKCVYVQAAQFTSAPIAKALVAAHDRGVDVKVVIDRKKESEKSEADRLTDAGIPTFTDGQHHTAHNKLVLIDHKLMFTGSFNFTFESEAQNAENLLLIRGKPVLVAAYENNFRLHMGHSTPYKK